MTDSSKNVAESHLKLYQALFKAIKHPQERVIDSVLWRLEGLEGMCETLALSIEEANIKNSSYVGTVAVSRVFSLLETEFRLLKVLIEHGLQDKSEEEPSTCPDCITAEYKIAALQHELDMQRSDL